MPQDHPGVLENIFRQGGLLDVWQVDGIHQQAKRLLWLFFPDPINLVCPRRASCSVKKAVCLFMLHYT